MRDQPFEPRCSTPSGLVGPVAVDPAGVHGPTRGQAAGSRWVRVAPNRYVPSAVDRTLPEQRVLEQACHLRGQGVVTGWAALRLARAAYFDGLASDGRTELPVLLAVGPGPARRRHEGIQYSYEPLAEPEMTTLLGVPVAAPRRALFDEMRRPGGWRRAVIAMDMAAAAELVSLTQMQAYLAPRTRWRRAAQVAVALRHASERSRSPAESRLRLLWVVDARLPAPAVNREVFDRQGRLICVADLFDEEAGLVVEYDGSEHRKARRHSRDVAREEACRRVGLEYCKVTGPDLHTTPLVIERFRSTRSRARFLPPAERRWTLAFPPGRPREEPLDVKLEHRAWLEAELARRGLTPRPD